MFKICLLSIFNVARSLVTRCPTVDLLRTRDGQAEAQYDKRSPRKASACCHQERRKNQGGRRSNISSMLPERYIVPVSKRIPEARWSQRRNLQTLESLFLIGTKKKSCFLNEFLKQGDMLKWLLKTQ